MFSQCGCGSQPQTYDSQKLATQQVDKSVSDLKEALNGLGDSLKKGDRKSFSLYKTAGDRDALNRLSKRASLEINTEANEIKSGKLPSPTATPDATVKPAPTTPEATPTPQ
jgi:hypothetical protein